MANISDSEEAVLQITERQRQREKQTDRQREKRREREYMRINTTYFLVSDFRIFS